MSSTHHTKNMYISLLCLFVLLVSSPVLFLHCQPLPTCLNDSECMPFRCVEQKCVKPSETAEATEHTQKEGPDRDTSNNNESPIDTDIEASEEPQTDTHSPESTEKQVTEEQFTTEASIDRTSEEITAGDAGEQPPESVPSEKVPESMPESVPEAYKKWLPLMKCNNKWIHSGRDTHHCGRCGKICPKGQKCCNGKCGNGSVEVCNNKDDDCDGLVDEDTKNCVQTFAGMDLSTEGPALWTPLSGPRGLALDKKGNLYISERNRYRIRKLSPDGILTTIAGSGAHSISGIGTGQKVTPKNANFYGPDTLIIDPADKIIYATQSGHGYLWQIPIPGATSDNRVTGIFFPSHPMGAAFTSPDELYLSKIIGHSIYKYNIKTKKTELYAGLGKRRSLDEKRLKAGFILPTKVIYHKKRNKLYVSDSGQKYAKIREIDIAKDLVSTYAGTYIAGNKNGTTADATFREIRGIVFDNNDNLYVADAGNHQIREVSNKKKVTTFAGSTPGYKDGKHYEALFYWPTEIIRDTKGNFYIADTGNNVIRKIDTQDKVSTIAGARFFPKRSLRQQQLNEPKGLRFDKKGNLYVVDAENRRVILFPPSGKPSIYLGSGANLLQSERANYLVPGETNVKPLHLITPTDIAIDNSGTVAISETSDHRILLITPGATKPYFYWGAFSSPSKDGNHQVAVIYSPRGLAFTKAGALLIAEERGRKIRIIDNKRTKMSTLAGSGAAGNNDGTASQATFGAPYGLLMDDTHQRLYISDKVGHRIRVYDFKQKTVSTLAGTTQGYGDHKTDSLKAKFDTPLGLAWGPQKKSILVADSENHCIRKIEILSNGKAGEVSTYIGTKRLGNSGGTPQQTRLSFPTHLVWGPKGKLYISDTQNHLIRVYQP